MLQVPKRSVSFILKVILKNNGTGTAFSVKTQAYAHFWHVWLSNVNLNLNNHFWPQTHGQLARRIWRVFVVISQVYYSLLRHFSVVCYRAMLRRTRWCDSKLSVCLSGITNIWTSRTDEQTEGQTDDILWHKNRKWVRQSWRHTYQFSSLRLASGSNDK